MKGDGEILLKRDGPGVNTLEGVISRKIFLFLDNFYSCLPTSKLQLDNPQVVILHINVVLAII